MEFFFLIFKYHIITKKSLADFKLPISDSVMPDSARDKSAKTSADLLSKIGTDIPVPKKKAGKTNLVMQLYKTKILCQSILNFYKI